MPDYSRINKKWWNDVTPIHARSKLYDLESFKKGKTSLQSIELEELKSVKGKTYQKVLDDTTNAMRMLVTNPELAQVQIELARTAAPTSRTASLSREEMGIRNYLLLLYGIF